MEKSATTVTAQEPPPPAVSLIGDTIGLSELAAEHELPRPDPNATEAELKRLGATLDREEFQIDDDGKPRLSKLTGAPKKKTGPKKGEIVPAAAAVPAGPDQFVMLGKIYATVFFNVCVGVFGEEWKPAADQKAEITEAFEVYARAKNLITLPPEVLLAAALLGYVNDKPQVKALRAKATVWIKSKVKNEQPATAEVNDGSGKN